MTYDVHQIKAPCNGLCFIGTVNRTTLRCRAQNEIRDSFNTSEDDDSEYHYLEVCTDVYTRIM